MSGAGATALVQTPEQVLQWVQDTYGVALTSQQQQQVAAAIGFTGSNWVPEMAAQAMQVISQEAERYQVPRKAATPKVTDEHRRRMVTLTRFHIAAFQELKIDEAIKDAINRMGRTQAAALLMQEQGKAEAQRVAKLRELGIAADPRPAMDMVQANQAVELLMSEGVTGVMSAVSNELSGAAWIESGPRAARHAPPRQFCSDFFWLKYGLLTIGGVTAFLVGGGWVVVAESVAYGFGWSFAGHTAAVAFIHEYGGC